MRNALAGISALGLLGFAALPVSAHEASQVHSDLRQRGYYDVQFVVAEPPFQVEACLEGQRFHLHVDFYGRVTERPQPAHAAVIGGGAAIRRPHVWRGSLSAVVSRLEARSALKRE